MSQSNEHIVYSDLPVYPAFVFDGDMADIGDVIFPGTKNPAYTGSYESVEILEGLNLSYRRYKIFHVVNNISTFVAHVTQYDVVPYPYIPIYPGTSFPPFITHSYISFSELPEFKAYFGSSKFSYEGDIAYNTTGENIPIGAYDNPYFGRGIELAHEYRNGNFIADDGYITGDSLSPFPLQYHVKTIPTKVKYLSKPSYIDLLSGYSLDDRVRVDYPVILPDETKIVTIGYYRENKTEPVPKLRSIDWMEYQCELVKNLDFALPIKDCVLGTLQVSDSITKSQLLNIDADDSKYPLSYYFESALPQIFSEWRELYNPTHLPEYPANGTGIFEANRTLRIIGANNDVWHNRSSPTEDFNTDLSHPMYRSLKTVDDDENIVFIVDNQRAYDWHLKPQSDGSYGDLIMNSPILEEIHRALNAGKWAVNTSDPTKPRIDNLGWRIERGNQVLGIRVKSDGKVDEELEKTVNRRLHADGSEQNDPLEFNPNCFGSKGMLVRHLPNKFDPSGTVAGGYRKVRDLPQYLAELHEQANAAMGYQEGTAIEIQIDGVTYRYPNQLALMTEMFVTMKQTATYSKGSFFSSLIAEQSIKEVMAGLGLRTVDKYLEFKVAGKATKLYYKGISASQSVRRKLSAVATNVGMVIGNII
jgi:hypothetical protein